MNVFTRTHCPFQTFFLKFALAIGLLLSAMLPCNADWMADRYMDVDRILNPIPKTVSPLAVEVDISLKQKFSDAEVKKFLLDEIPEISSVAIKPFTNLPASSNAVQSQMTIGGKTVNNEFAFAFNAEQPRAFSRTDPLISFAVPLSAAIRDARERLIAKAKPLPESLKKTLGRMIPKILLDRVRYTVGDLKIVLPRTGSFNHLLFENDNTVILDDLIVFHKTPALEKQEDIRKWVHAIQHVYQYRNWGVELFAYRILKHNTRVEGEAAQSASFIMSYLSQLGKVEPVEPKIDFTEIPRSKRVNVETPLGETTVLKRTQTAGLSGNRPYKNAKELCRINGDHFIVDTNGLVFSLSQMDTYLATAIRPYDNISCEYDLWFSAQNQRLCVQRRSRLVYKNTRPFHVGQCKKCETGACF